MEHSHYDYFGRFDREAPAERRPNFAFVDADNIAAGLINLLRQSGIDEDRYRLFSVEKLIAMGGHDRVFLYSAKDPEKYAEQWFETLERSDGFILRTGRLTNKKGINKQEGVDVLLAVDAMRHASMKNMASCSIYSGDGDFVPLVEALVEAGIFVSVASFSDPQQGQVAPSLQAKADRYLRLHGNLLFNRAQAGGWGDVEILSYKIDPNSSYFSDFIEIENGRGRFRVSRYIDGLRFFWRGTPNDHVVKFSHAEQADMWLRLVWPALGAEPFWPDAPP